MKMTTSAAFYYLHRGKSLVASIPSSGPSHLAWVGVYPFDTSRQTTREFIVNHGQAMPLPGVRLYRIRRFEVKRTLIEQEASIAEPELEKAAHYFAYGDDELVEKLSQLGVRIEQLEQPWKSNYPI